jgi:endonuclease YncB( thermonuclease family)
MLTCLSGCWYAPPDGIDLVRDVPVTPNNLGGTAFVACVLDGDTVDLFSCASDDGETIRLLGINAPEIEHPGNDAECYGPEAADFMTGLLLGREVVVTYDQGKETDLYGRTLAYLWAIDDTLADIADNPGVNELLELDSPLAEDGKALMINEYLAEEGYARVFAADVFGELIYQQRLEAAQAEAQADQRGLWANCETATGTRTARTRSDENDSNP